MSLSSDTSTTEETPLKPVTAKKVRKKKKKTPRRPEVDLISFEDPISDLMTDGVSRSERTLIRDTTKGTTGEPVQANMQVTQDLTVCEIGSMGELQNSLPMLKPPMISLIEESYLVKEKITSESSEEQTTRNLDRSRMDVKGQLSGPTEDYKGSNSLIPAVDTPSPCVSDLVDFSVDSQPCLVPISGTEFIEENSTSPDCEPATDHTDRLQVVDGIGRTFTILKTGTASMIHIPLKCNQRPIVAVIDTAAEVTIMSDKVYQSLKNQPPILRKTVMYAAGRGMQMDTMVVGPVELEIQSKMYFSEVYVATH